ncbi:MAG: DUF4870 family protein [Burkholderiales bacterium]
MTDTTEVVTAKEPTREQVMLTHLMYAMHLFSAVAGLSASVFIVTAFLSGWPSIIAVILNYIKRGDVAGTFLESHFRWQLRTFWVALLWVVLCLALVMTLIFIVVAWPLAVVVGLWVLYRLIRGWLALVDRKPLPLG